MPQLLVIDWDQREARYLLAAVNGESLHVSRASSKALTPQPAGSKAQWMEEIGAWLRDELSNQRKGRMETLVALSRSGVETMSFTLPPGTPEELPELVLNQAMRESNTTSEETLLDFVPVQATNGEWRVTAMAVSQEAEQHVRAICAEAGVVPRQLLLRPYAAVSLVTRRCASSSAGAWLIVNMLAEEADLTVVVDGQIILSRTVRLPSDPSEAEAHQALRAEMQRTMRVAQSQTPSGEFAGVYVLGSVAEHPGLAQRAQQELNVPVQLVDPWDAETSCDVPVPPNPGRFAALLAMAYDRGHGQAPAMDFLNPRRKPAPPNRRKLAIIGAVTATIVGGALAYRLWDDVSRLNAEQRRLDQRVAELNGLVKRAAKQERLVNAVRDWKRSDLVLLDEFRDLALRLPKARDMVVLRLSNSPTRNGASVFNLQGLVRDPLVVSRMERELEDPYHEVRSPRYQGLQQDEDFTWRFESTVTVVPRTKQQYLASLDDSRNSSNQAATETPSAGQTAKQSRPDPSTAQQPEQPRR
jgi:Tfp pilus assembly PilM family ATPase